MPRLLFGPKEDNNGNDENSEQQPGRLSHIPAPFDANKFETVRWKYHSDFDNDIKLNGKPKVVLDLSVLPPLSSFINKGVFSIHRPGMRVCRSNKEVLFGKKSRFPITVNHYLGSWERYSHRNDARRSRHVSATQLEICIASNAKKSVRRIVSTDPILAL
jgi:hypothetical protein